MVNTSNGSGAKAPRTSVARVIKVSTGSTTSHIGPWRTEAILRGMALPWCPMVKMGDLRVYRVMACFSKDTLGSL